MTIITPLNLDQSVASGASPKIIKKLEKKYAKDAKREGEDVKQVLKDVQSIEKEKAKAQKASRASIKAEQKVEKINKLETATQKVLNKAVHQHETAVVELQNAERDAELKRQEDKRLAAELDAKRALAAEALKMQIENAEGRANQLRELRGEGTTTPDSTLSETSSH
ncbi:unnamed protein product [Mycena citricolor]|uniref:Uncharacterized protein n=1 Tax=Mycena citricolor TaxID=2018698 RepID=A0AAD2K304_9AGAR|nr:unnamed protein product [Mycena citricolor]